MTLAERLIQQGLDRGRQEGRQEGRREGRKEGRHEGRIEALQAQLELRFGPVPTELLDRLRSATIGDLDRWTARVLTAVDADAVFAD